jgi:hypothetical protein
MELNYSYIIIFLLAMVAVFMGYYHFILTVDAGNDKRLTMAKRVLMLFTVGGLLHIYSITENTQLKQFFIVMLAVILNMYSVYHSTGKCNFPKLFVIRLCLYSAAITLFIAGALWYTTNNSLFGFMVVPEEAEEVVSDAQSFFSSKVLSGITLDNKVDCPVPGSSDYTSEMNQLHTSSKQSDKDTYTACLEKEVRADLARGV